MNPASTAPETLEFEPVTLPTRMIYVAGVSLPLVGAALMIWSLWGHGFSWVQMGLLLGMYVISAAGISVGYHRLFTHRAFETHPVIKWILAICGSMALEGPVIKWAAMHRRHHQRSDRGGDPHSPHHHGTGFLGVIRGFWHAHVGWLFQGDPKDLSRYITDLLKDRSLRIVSKLWWVWAILGILIPTLIGGLATMSWKGALLGFIWGGLARIFLVHHMTWSINSICHLWGTRPFRSHDESRNNFFFGVIGFGEGWHNNHHAFPASARHGLRWWQIDLSFMAIRGLEKLGLAWEVRVPSAASLAAKQRVMT